MPFFNLYLLAPPDRGDPAFDFVGSRRRLLSPLCLEHYILMEIVDSAASAAQDSIDLLSLGEVLGGDVWICRISLAEALCSGGTHKSVRIEQRC
jgi:hypothetical protein